MPDQPDVPDVEAGTRQPSDRIATQFVLNQTFVEAVGADAAQAMLDHLRRVAADHGDADVTTIRERIREGLDRLGISLSDVEVDSFADQIARSESVVPPGDLHPDAP